MTRRGVYGISGSRRGLKERERIREVERDSEENGRKGNNGGTERKGDDVGIRPANAFISIRRGRVTCSPLRSISSTSFVLSSLLSFPADSRISLFTFCSVPSPARSLSRSRFLHPLLPPPPPSSFPYLPLFVSSLHLFLLLLSYYLSSLWTVSLMLFSLRADLFLFPRREHAKREYFFAFARPTTTTRRTVRAEFVLFNSSTLCFVFSFFFTDSAITRVL